MKVNELKEINGKYFPHTREMTPEEEAQMQAEMETLQDNNSQEKTDALTAMITEMSQATTLAQMRNAAKAFLEKTE